MSEYDLAAAERRDFRNAKDGPEAPRHRSQRNKKSCKNSPDKIHTWEATEESWVGMPGVTWLESRCVYCGKREVWLR